MDAHEVAASQLTPTQVEALLRANEELTELN